jgi:hypothetical protein
MKKRRPGHPHKGWKAAARKRHETPVPRKLAFIFGDVAMTFTPEDIETVWKAWEAKHPGKRGDIDMPSAEFIDACMEQIKASARPTRTVIHN